MRLGFNHSDIQKSEGVCDVSAQTQTMKGNLKENKSIAPKHKKLSILSEHIKYWDLMLLFLPGLLLLIIFKYVPMYGILIAFKDYKMLDGVMASPWVGMEHFKRLFQGHDFVNVLRNTIVISFLKMLFGFPAPIILAILLNEVKSSKYKRLVQTFSQLPHFFSWVVLGGIITMVFSSQGPVNELLKIFGMKEGISFFGKTGAFIFLLIFTAVWQSIGWGSIIYLASITGIDETIYEAATIDGAGRWKQIINITVPCLIPTIVTMFILNLGHVMDAGFDQIFNLYNPTVYEVSDILDTYVFRRLQAMDYSFGTAVGLFKSVVGLILVVTTNWVANKISDGEQGIW